jgi:hypothetical protein
MVVLLRKKKSLHPSHVRGSIVQQRPPKNQLVETVAPFDELPSFDSFRFKVATIRRKHSAQREQLAKLKALNLFESAGLDCMHLVNSASNTGLTTTPAPVQTDDETILLEQPIELRHQGISCKSSRLSALTTKTANFKALPSKMTPLERHKEMNRPILSTDVYATGGGCFGAHQVPCIISITRLVDGDGDANSDISLEEDVFRQDPFSSFSSSSAEQPTTAGETIGNSAIDTWSHQHHNRVEMTLPPAKSCFLATEMDWDSWSSSISWPSDEDDDDDDVVKADNSKKTTNQHKSTLSMITGMKDLTFSDNGSDSQSYFRPRLACGGFKFWSEEEIQKLNFGMGTQSNPEAARDEEDCRGRVSANDKEREEVYGVDTFRE